MDRRDRNHKVLTENTHVEDPDTGVQYEVRGYHADEDRLFLHDLSDDSCVEEEWARAPDGSWTHTTLTEDDGTPVTVPSWDPCDPC